jgi:septal ring factor EnvC (AmiA/AmiB activator)
MNKLPLLFVGVLAVAAGATIFLQSRHSAEQAEQIRRLSMQLTAAQTLADHTQHELSDARAKSEVYRLESEGLRNQLAGSSTSTATVLENTPSSALASAAADSESQETGGMMKSLAKMYSDPEMRQALRSQQAMGIQMMYG